MRIGSNYLSIDSQAPQMPYLWRNKRHPPCQTGNFYAPYPLCRKNHSRLPPAHSDGTRYFTLLSFNGIKNELSQYIKSSPVISFTIAVYEAPGRCERLQLTPATNRENPGRLHLATCHTVKNGCFFTLMSFIFNLFLRKNKPKNNIYTESNV